MFLISGLQAVNLLLLGYGNMYQPSQYPYLYVNRHVIFLFSRCLQKFDALHYQKESHSSYFVKG